MQFTWGHLLGHDPEILALSKPHSWLGVPMHFKSNQVSVCLHKLLNMERSSSHLENLHCVPLVLCCAA